MATTTMTNRGVRETIEASLYANKFFYLSLDQNDSDWLDEIFSFCDDFKEESSSEEDTHLFDAHRYEIRLEKNDHSLTSARRCVLFETDQILFIRAVSTIG